MKKTATIILISFLFLIIAAITVLFILILNGDIKINGLKIKFNNSYIKEVAVEEIYENTFDKIIIETNAGDINIYESEDENIKLVVYNKKDRTTVNVDNNVLDITAKSKKCNFICINPKIAKIDLYLPKTFDKDIKITTQYGDVKIDSLGNTNFNVKSNYGDIKINDANKADLDVDYGDIKIDTVNELIIDSNLGDIKVDTVNDYINIQCDYGDIKIGTVNLTRDSKIKDDFGDIEIKNIKGVYIDAKTDLGDVDIKGNDKKSDITLTIKNDCGDIEVN